MNIKNNNLCKTVLAIAPTLLFVFIDSINLQALASYMGNNHGYAVQFKDINNHGQAFVTSYGQEDLYQSSSGSGAAITKEMWVIFNKTTRNHWIEVGDVKGKMADNLQQVNLTLSQKSKVWAGHFVAYQTFNNSTGQDEYRETAFDSYAPTGVHKYSISYIGSNTWVIYADDARVLTLSGITYTYAQRLQLGIETKDTTNYFDPSTLISSIQGKDTNGIWQGWTSASNGDYNTSSVAYGPWTSIFSLNTSTGGNSITFTRK